MLLDKEISIIVFRIDEQFFEQVGEIQYTSLIWPDAYNGYANFELWAPINSDNAELIKKDNVIWTGGENAAVIEIIKQTVDNKGKKTYNVKGRTLEKYLADRIIWGTFIGSGFASTIMYDLVNSQCVNPTKSYRKIPWLTLATDNKYGVKITQYQKTGGELYDSLTSLAVDSDLGFSVLFDPENKSMVFEVRKGVDRTENNTDGEEPVVFSTELEDILSSSYYSNSQDEKNVAFVQGEDSGANRKSVTVGSNIEVSGFKRKELYVDARDLQSEVYNEDGTTTPLSPEEYTATLTQRGNEKLSEYPLVETFEAQIRQFGDVQYEYGKDYFKGDKVTIIDEELNISVSARITQVEEDFDEEYALVLTFGYSYPTTLQKVKRMTT